MNQEARSQHAHRQLCCALAERSNYRRRAAVSESLHAPSVPLLDLPPYCLPQICTARQCDPDSDPYREVHTDESTRCRVKEREIDTHPFTALVSKPHTARERVTLATQWNAVLDTTPRCSPGPSARRPEPPRVPKPRGRKMLRRSTDHGILPHGPYLEPRDVQEARPRRTKALEIDKRHSFCVCAPPLKYARLRKNRRQSPQ